MKGALIAAVSFLLGCLVTMLFANNWIARPVSAQVVDTRAYIPKVPQLRAAVPTVLPLSGIHMDDNLMGSPEIYLLDGIEASNNVYFSPNGTTLLYGGGAYKLENARFGGKVTLRLIGAAANTAQLLRSFGLLPENAPLSVTLAPAKVETNKPIIHTVVIKKPWKGDIASQYDGTNGAK